MGSGNGETRSRRGPKRDPPASASPSGRRRPRRRGSRPGRPASGAVRAPPVGGRLVALAIGLALALIVGEVLARLVLPPPPIVSVVPDPGLARRLADERSAPRAIRERDESEPGGEFMLATPTGLRLRAATSVVIENQSLSN